MANPDERLVPLKIETDDSAKVRFIKYLNIINVYLNKGLAYIAATSLLLMVFTVVINAVSRRVYIPFVGTAELVGWLAAVTLAFGLGFTQLQQGYVEIDALVDRMPLKIQKFIKSIMLFISVCFFAIVAWEMVFYGLNVAENGNLSETMKISFYPLIFLVAVGFAGLTLALSVDFLKEVIGRAGHE